MKRHVESSEDHHNGDAKSAELSAATLTQAPTTSSGISLRHTATSSAASSHQRDDAACKRISSTPVPFGSLSEAFGYLVFLIVFILTTSVLEESEQAFYFANRIKTAVVDQPFAIPVTLRSTSGAVLASASSGSGSSSSSSVQKSFRAIQDQTDVWAFLQGPFMDVIYGPEMDTGGDSSSTEPEATGMVLSYNRVLGGVRLRTLRVEPDSCPSLSQIPEYSSIVPYCYGSFASDIEQTRGYGPILNSDAITASICYAFAKSFFADKATTKTYSDLQICYSDCDRTCGDHFGVEKYRYVAACTQQCGIHCKCIYEQPAGFELCADPNPNGAGGAIPSAQYSYNWSSTKDTKALSSSGYTGTSYAGSGYVVDLVVDGSVAREALAKLRGDRYLDLATRALIVDVTVYNAYLQLFNIVQLVVEFPATGGSFVQFSDVVLHPFRYSSTDLGRIVLECLLVAYVAVRWKSMLQGMYRRGGVFAFLRGSVWNAITCLYLLVFTAVIAFRLYLIDQAYGTLSGHVASAIDSASLDAIPNFQSLARLCYAESVLSSVNAAFVWLKLLQYTQVSKRMCLLLRMLHRAAMDLFWFFVYFIVCICAFAQIGFLLFGLSVRQFRSLGVSTLTLLQSVAGDLDYDAMADAHHVLGPLFYIAFYLLLLLILLNVFLAILNDAYLQTISEQEEEDDDEDDRIEDEDGEEGDAQRRALDHGHDLDGDNAAMEAHLDRKVRREMEQLRKYPFSKGIVLAVRLLLIELKHTMHEFRTGRKLNLTKVDPFVSATASGADGNGRGRAAGSSRKWAMQVKKQLEKQLQKHETSRMSQELERKEAQMATLRSTIDREIAERLVVLVDSNRQKTQRMHDMEKMLGSIESLCQKLITETAYLREDSDDDASQSAPKSALSATAIAQTRNSGQRQQRPTTLGMRMSSPSSLSPAKRATVMLKPPSHAGQGQEGQRGRGGSSKRLIRKGSAEEIEEITL